MSPLSDFKDETCTELYSWAKHLFKACKDELRYLEMCDECYKISSEGGDWFTTVCSRRHRVVWADYGKYPSWPAKVLREEKYLITVQFFGDHTTARVKCKKVTEYSRKNPNKQLDTKQRTELNKCLPVSEFYCYFNQKK